MPPSWGAPPTMSVVVGCEKWPAVTAYPEQGVVGERIREGSEGKKVTIFLKRKLVTRAGQPPGRWQGFSFLLPGSKSTSIRQKIQNTRKWPAFNSRMNITISSELVFCQLWTVPPPQKKTPNIVKVWMEILRTRRTTSSNRKRPGKKLVEEFRYTGKEKNENREENTARIRFVFYTCKQQSSYTPKWTAFPQLELLHQFYWRRKGKGLRVVKKYGVNSLKKQPGWVRTQNLKYISKKGTAFYLKDTYQNCSHLLH